jgi:hypothetical protein
VRRLKEEHEALYPDYKYKPKRRYKNLGQFFVARTVCNKSSMSIIYVFVLNLILIYTSRLPLVTYCNIHIKKWVLSLGKLQYNFLEVSLPRKAKTKFLGPNWLSHDLRNRSRRGTAPISRLHYVCFIGSKGYRRYPTVFFSVAEPHHFYAVPAPGKMFKTN